MKFYTYTALTIGLLLTGLGSLTAQNRVCGSEEAFNQMLQNVPGAREDWERTEARYEAAAQRGEARGGGVRVIPCVVHIIQTSGMEIVTAADVQSQIDVLNEDFRKIAGTNGDGNGVDMLYEFCLASVDPNGCPTTGINRVISPQYAFHEQADAALMKGLIQWDPHMYLNIWVPRTIETSSGSGQVIGYATFPSSLNFQPNLDGIVIHSGYFGRDSDPTTIGRTTTHEVGHWIGLFHTFQNGCQGSSASTCLSGGDRVCDTPQAFDQNFGCPSINSCVDTPTDLPDQIENYMDYSDGTCQNMYTAGQKTRADQIMANYRSQIYSASNLAATGCDGSSAPGCVPTTDFESDKLQACVGTPVNFTDISYGAPTAWNWSFQGGTPASSTSQNPTVIYTAPGTYNVTLSTANGQGTNTEVKTGYITISNPVNPPIAESFESVTTIPTGWATWDEDQIGTWTLVTNAGSVGTKSMKVKCFDTFSEGGKDNLNTNGIDLTNALEAWLTYDWSYKKKSAFALDSFLVNVSTDCGVSWINLETKVGATLVTVGGLSTAVEYVPTMTSQWFSDTISLDSFIGQANLKVQFQVRGYNGQSVYLDNVNLGSVSVGLNDVVWNEGNLTVSPNPFRNELNLDYTISKAGQTHFSIVDALGKQVYSHSTGKQAAGSYRITVSAESLHTLPAGIYFLKADSPNGIITRKLVHMD